EEPVLDGTRLAFVGVAYHVLLVAGRALHALPLCERRESCAAQSAQVRGLERREHAGPVPRLQELTERRIRPTASVGIDEQRAMRVEGREALEMVQRGLRLRRQGLQFLRRKIAMSVLNRPEVVEDQAALSRVPFSVAVRKEGRNLA